MKKLVIATRQSRLALWQANYIKQQLQQHYPLLVIELMGITTEGDKRLDQSLAKIGGKGLFLKELQTALLTGDADIAVHSMKDVPMALPKELELASICQRANPYDVFVSSQYACFEQLPVNAIVGTSSMRRQAQLLALRPDLTIKMLRGNIDTRLTKLQEAHYDAIILAAAGLERLQLTAQMQHHFTLQQMLPAVAQGALGIECCRDNVAVKHIVACLHDCNTALCIGQERSFVQTLQGDCHSPIGVYANIHNQQLLLQGMVASIDGKTILRDEITGECSQQLGRILAEKLIHQGAQEILQSLPLH